MLNVIQKENLVDTVVVVTRYFGGILLGTGGLARAYGQTAKLGITDAVIVERNLCDIVSIKTDYTLEGRIRYKISSEGYISDDTIYGNDVTFIVYTKCGETQKFIDAVTDITNGRAACDITGVKYVDFDSGGGKNR